jgi:hypothetical protein
MNGMDKFVFAPCLLCNLFVTSLMQKIHHFPEPHAVEGRSIDSRRCLTLLGELHAKAKPELQGFTPLALPAVDGSNTREMP